MADDGRQTYNRQYYEANKDVYAVKWALYYARNKARIQMRKIQRLYGVTPEQYDALYEACKGKCEICKTPIGHAASSEGRATKACLDHDHSTGKARGLLCTSCNSKLSLFDNHKEAVVAYMEKHK